MLRKGITPVIAIVLLLLITVSAVGVLYTQTSGLLNPDPENEVEEIGDMANAEYSIIGVVKSNNGKINVTVKNTEDTVFNLSKRGTLKIGKDGASPVAVTVQGGSCNLGTLGEGQSSTCNTGIDWGNANDGEPTSIQLMVGKQQKASYTCREESGQNTC